MYGKEAQLGLISTVEGCWGMFDSMTKLLLTQAGNESHFRKSLGVFTASDSRSPL
jgi:hypothetical protein